MADSDQEIINQALSFVDYDEVFTNQEVQEIVDIGKEEIRADLGFPDELAFYSDDPAWIRHVDRALFWFTVIGLKVRSHEIASVNLTVGSIRSTAYTGGKFSYLFENFDKRMQSAEGAIFGGASLVNLTRTRRTYEDPDA